MLCKQSFFKTIEFVDFIGSYLVLINNNVSLL